MKTQNKNKTFEELKNKKLGNFAMFSPGNSVAFLSPYMTFIHLEMDENLK